MNLLRDAAGRVRAPYVVGLFTVVAIVLEGGLSFLLGVNGLLRFVDLDSPRVIFSTGPSLVSGIVATWITWLAFREPTGLPDSKRGRRFATGFLIGACTLVIACVVPALVGVTSLTATSGGFGVVAAAGLTQFITLSPAAFGEELLLRSLGFQALRRGMGDVAAVAFTSLVFGGLHLFNPGAT